MRNPAREPDQASGSQRTALLADLVGELARGADHDLVLRLVHVQRWTSGQDDTFEHRDHAVRLLSRHLERQHRTAAHVEGLERILRPERVATVERHGGSILPLQQHVPTWLMAAARPWRNSRPMRKSPMQTLLHVRSSMWARPGFARRCCPRPRRLRRPLTRATGRT